MLTALTSFGILMAIFLPLELVFPAHRRKYLRREHGTDLLFAAGQFLFWTTPVVVVLTWVYRNSGALPLAHVRATVAAWPMWIQVIAVILLCDMSIYWGHRLQHRIPFLWRFHRVHHTSKELDVLAAYREHPLDNLYTRLIENLPAILLGFPLYLLAGFAMFRGLWALLIHSNVSLSPGPLRYLLGSPRLHHWHHETDHGSHVNFGNVSPLMDVLFGTFYDPGHMPTQYGISDPVSSNYFVQLADPLLPRRARARLQAIAASRQPQESRRIDARVTAVAD